MIEIEKKAEEYAKKPSKLLLESLCCGSDLPENDYTLEEVAEPIKQAYIDGYEQGQKDNCENHKECQFLKYFEKENEELMNALEKCMPLKLANQLKEENKELKKAVAEKNSEVQDIANINIKAQTIIAELNERLRIESQSLHEQCEIVSKQVEQIENLKLEITNNANCLNCALYGSPYCKRKTERYAPCKKWKSENSMIYDVNALGQKIDRRHEC